MRMAFLRTSYWMVGLLGMGILAGCGFNAFQVPRHPSHISLRPSLQHVVPKSHTPSVPSPTSSDMMPHTLLLQLGALSVRVPNIWKAQSHTLLSPGARQMIAVSNSAHLTMTLDPLSRSTVFQLLPQLPKPQGLTKNPWNQSPYFTETVDYIDGEIYVTMSDVSTSGSRYVLNLYMPKTEATTAWTIIKSIKAPVPLDLSQGIRLLLAQTRLSSTPPEATWSMGQDRWLLVGGEPATAQEPFFLLRSQDGGKNWNLINYTHWTAVPYQVFPNTVGNPAIVFWNAQDGLIAQPSYATPQLLLFRTTNGGMSWNESRLDCPSQPRLGKAPSITLMGHGHVTVSVLLRSGKTFTVSSQNHGISWQS